MTKKCLICNKDSESFLCAECAKKTDVEMLCYDISSYTIGGGKNENWDLMFADKTLTKDAVFELVQSIHSPIAEMILINCLAMRNKNGIKISDCYQERFKELAEVCLNSPEITTEEKNFIKALFLSNNHISKNWNVAEEYAASLYNGKHTFKKEVYLILIDYYIKTRRYDKADLLLDEGACKFDDDLFETYRKDCLMRSSGQKKHYIPVGAEHQADYIRFLETIETEVKPNHIYVPKKSKCSKSKITEDDYPCFDFVNAGEFKSFVAYDTETTGLSNKQDCIVEIGAIKVVNGEVIEKAEFMFQELIHPYAGVTGMSWGAMNATGITDDMLVDARNVVEVFNAFADFIGDDILIGFNNKVFDAIRLRRAGRYAGRIITNKQLDVMIMARKLGIKGSLGDISKKFGIINPNAHRAYADAWTTAKVYLKLLEIKDTFHS